MDNKTIAHILDKLCHNCDQKYYIYKNFQYKNGIHFVLFKSHWIVIFIENNSVDFFDSFGRPPIHFFLRFKNKHVNIYSKNVQDKNSTLCGYYCIAFVYMKMYKMLNEFFQMFTDNKILNDKKIVHIVYKIINLFKS